MNRLRRGRRSGGRQSRRRSARALLVLVSLLFAGPAAAFAPGELYWVPGSCPSTCGIYDVTGGGDELTASPLAVIARSPGQIAWDTDLGNAYVTQYDADTIVRISEAGAVTTFATGLDGVTGLVRTQDGRLLAASYRSHAVYDVTSGGDFLGATPFANGFGGARNLVQLDSGEILIADQSRHVVYDISEGGVFGVGAPAYASGLPSGPYDLVEDAQGRLFASTDSAVYEITGGGDFTLALPHASGLAFSGLAADASGHLFATEFNTGNIFDVTASGDYAAASPYAWNLDGYGDTALDAAPPPPPVVPALDARALCILAALLLAAATASLRLRARREPAIR